MAFAWRIGAARIAFSTIADGDMREATARATFLERIGAPPALAVGGQVHGVAIAAVDAPTAAPLPGVDALLSPRQDLVLGAFGADCPGLVLLAGGLLAVAHCGWRGVAAGMVDALAAALLHRGAPAPATWQAFIGPGIAGERYEVDSPVLTARCWPAGSWNPGRPGHGWLDLASAITADLAAQGVGAVDRADVCTAAEPALHSYRHQGRGCQQLLVAWR